MFVIEEAAIVWINEGEKVYGGELIRLGGVAYLHQ